ncbi:MAG: ParB N-terminal domain-containing protein [Gammaproteobacteria bacterium]|nr:ParB N-terminal domain-containing protein [Gammaproteobacteria bacterium]MCB1903861.1 ParB N-terminal domain-containing protein [Gammaproteobacteria bacterium]
MKNNELSEEQIMALTENNDSNDSTTGNSIEQPDLVMLPLTRVRPYEHNPRHGINPEYQRIKASIVAEGMDQPLVVTQRPGESDYIVYAGGNTRLRILQELYEETAEARFRNVCCIYRPWTREADVLIAHLRENDLRGDLTFIDKAFAIQETKRLIKQEEGEGCVSQDRLVEVLRESGYALNQGLISRMEYAVERLLPLIPLALHAGLGRPQVERIRQLERMTRALWLDRSVDTEEEFDQAFTALCKRYDSPEWDIANLRRALEAEMAERTEVSIHAVSMVLEGYLAGHGESDADIEWLAEPEEDDPEFVIPDTGIIPERKTSKATSASPSESGTEESESDETEQSEPKNPEDEPAFSFSEDDHQTSSINEFVQSQTGDSVPPGTAQKMPTDLKSLRARAWVLASRLAQRNGLSELIQPLSGNGLGFLLSDVPDPALLDQLDEERLAQLSMVWWHLAAAAEMTVAPLDQLLPSLPEASVLRQALEAQDAGLLFSSVWTLDPGHMGYRLWRRLDEPDWRDLIDLMETYRSLHRSAETSGEPLWS